jgi:hypothetical protein
MSVVHAVKNAVKTASSAGGAVGNFSSEVIDSLADAAEEFALAPDEFVDVMRLPPGVTNLAGLFSYLRTIQQKLSKRDNKVKNEDWEVAKTGELRLYKLFVCCIHGLAYYVMGTPDYSVNISAFASAVIIHSRTTQPVGLAQKGKTLWEKTFSDAQPRTHAVMRTLIYFCMRETVTGSSVIPDKGVEADKDKPGTGDESKTPETSDV